QDLDGKRLYSPVDLNHPDARAGGIEPSDSNPHFHQQMAYAVVSHLLRTFDRALGRQMRFGDGRNRLEVMPHGFDGANAYYIPAKPALAFGYFFTGKTTTDRQIPGRPDYACLDHGILVRETTHALLDGLRPSLSLVTGVDSMPFHEGFADIVVLLHML